MFEGFFSYLMLLDKLCWGYVAFSLVFLLGIYLTFKSRFFQFRHLPAICKSFFEIFQDSEKGKRGVHPFKAFFATLGGQVGIGNICGVVAAVQMGGPGALLWLWVAAIIGSIIKYGDIYLGVKYRVPNEEGGWDGGPMYYIKAAFKNRFLPMIVALFLCLYGVEIYQFSVITETVSANWHLNRILISFVLLALVLFASLGGVKRIGLLASYLIPVFIISYLGMGSWVLFCEGEKLPALIGVVFSSAFSGHAAVGGFAGSSIIMAIQYGTARAAYASDLGIGSGSIILSETSSSSPATQGRLAIFGILINIVVCTFSILLALISGFWKSSLPASEVVRAALGQHFPFMSFFIPLFFILTGFATIMAAFVVGLKCAKYLNKKWGNFIFIAYGVPVLLTCSFFEQSQALLVMSLLGVILLIINFFGIFRLRKEIGFVETLSPATLVDATEKS